MTGDRDGGAEVVQPVNSGTEPPGEEEAVVFHDAQGRPAGKAAQHARPEPAGDGEPARRS